MPALQNWLAAAKAIKSVNDVGKDAWRKKMFQNRWKNFITVWIFLGVCGLFLFLGHTQKSHFFTIVHWYLYMGLSYFFSAIGMYTMLSYLKMIVRGKK